MVCELIVSINLPCLSSNVFSDLLYFMPGNLTHV